MPAPRGHGAAPLTQRLIRGGGWVLLGRAVALPVGLLQAMLLARVLAPADVGAYFLAISLVIPLAIMSQLGLSRPMVKLVASALALERPNAARHAIRVAVPATLVVGSLLALGVADGPGRWLTSLLQDGERLRAALPILALMGLCFALIDLMAETLRGFHDLRAASAFGDFLVQRLLLVLALATLWLGGWPAEVGDVLTLALLAALLVLALAAGLLRRRLRALPHRGARFGTGEILRHGPAVPPGPAERLDHRRRGPLGAGHVPAAGGGRRVRRRVAHGAAGGRSAHGLQRRARADRRRPLQPPADRPPGEGGARRGHHGGRTFGAARAAVRPVRRPPAGAAVHRRLSRRLSGVVCLALGQWVNVAFGSCAISLTMTGHQRDVMIASTVTAAATIVGFYLVAPYGTLAVAGW